MKPPLEPLALPRTGRSSKTDMTPEVCTMPGDLITPVGAYQALKGTGASFLLESVERGESVGRYSFVGASPQGFLRCEGGRSHFRDLVKGREEDLGCEDPLEALSRVMSKWPATAPPEAGLPPFMGGAVGYLSYEAVRFWERFPSPGNKPGTWPDAFFMFTDTLVAFDHLAQKIYLIARPTRGREDARRRIERTARALYRAPKPGAAPPRRGPRVKAEPSAADFRGAVRRAKEYIACGDIIQVVPSRRFEVAESLRPLSVYRALRSVNPSPYMYLLQFPGRSLAGSSPETLVRVEGRRALTHPIAGSRPRGRGPEEDAKAEAELSKDPKERAEHVMLVDLARNDLGRVCRYGSIKVNDPLHVERFSHVMHLVSEVEGELRGGQDALDALRATFPAGTLTGAPKVRAMEIINELEPWRRGPYGGAVGYLDYSGHRLDTCITIRTVAFQGRKATFQAGAGIVADSKPQTELKEVDAKGEAMRTALSLALSGVFG